MKACHCSCLSLFFIDSKRRQRKDLLTVHTIIYKLRVEGETFAPVTAKSFQHDIMMIWQKGLTECTM